MPSMRLDRTSGGRAGLYRLAPSQQPWEPPQMYSRGPHTPPTCHPHPSPSDLLWASLGIPLPHPCHS